MPYRRWFIAFTLLLLAVVAPAQQAAPKAPIRPTLVDDNFLQQSGARAEFDHGDRTSPTLQNTKTHGRVLTVPTFTTSLSALGQNYPVTMVGSAPEKGEATEIPTQMIAISLFFEGYMDSKGQNVVLDAAPLLPRVLNSPNFHSASYRTGVTQFADAVQRAQFSSTMKDDWHTLLRKPEHLTPVQIDVPANPTIARVYQVRSTGATFAIVDTSFFISQLNTIIQLQKLDVQGLAIALTNNVFLSPTAAMNECCVVGFHTAFDASAKENRQAAQTFVWASYASPGVFGGTFEDVIALSHEISEWMNDPFVTNAVPRWQYPGSTECQGSLETGDPLEGVLTAGFPVIIDGFTYHPQTQALMQWFARKTPSDALGGAYSFPDESLLTAPAQACAAGR